MALTREFIRKLAKESDVELPKEFIDGIITEHTTARDAYADEQVKAELAKQPSAQNVNVKETEEYKSLKKSFDYYKAGIDAVAFGSDFDGIGNALDFGDYSGMPKVIDALSKHFTDDEIEKICWKNAYRVIGESMK